MKISASLSAVVRTAAVALWLSAPGCGGNSSGEYIPVPRPRAYPRLAVAEESYRRVEGAPKGFSVSTSATVFRPSSLQGDAQTPQKGEWLTVAYPGYGTAEIYYTFTPVDTAELRSVMANRLERIGLNFGGVPFESEELSTPAGYQGALFFTREPVATPIQFICVSPATVVSGSLFMPSFAENPDSMRPALEVIRRDITHSLEFLE